MTDDKALDDLVAHCRKMQTVMLSEGDKPKFVEIANKWGGWAAAITELRQRVAAAERNLMQALCDSEQASNRTIAALKECENAESALAERDRRIAELEADAGRIDWCEREREPVWIGTCDVPDFCEKCSKPTYVEQGWTTPTINPKTFPTIRAAIDAARKGST